MPNAIGTRWHQSEADGDGDPASDKGTNSSVKKQNPCANACCSPLQPDFCFSHCRHSYTPYLPRLLVEGYPSVAEGRIADLTTPIGTLLPNLSSNTTTARGFAIAALPLCRLLDMRSGISFQPDGPKEASGSGPKDFETTKFNPFGPMARLHTGGLAVVATHLVTSTAPQAQRACRGGSYSYQNVNTALLGAILERA